MRSTVANLLAAFEPQTEHEARDLARVRQLLQTERDPWSRATPLHLTASALIVHPATGHVLLRWHERQQAWLQVGGHADPAEQDPLAIASREATEETGLSDLVPWPDACLRHAVIVGVPAGRGEPAHEHADLRFVLATASPQAVRAETAAALLRWLSVAEAATLTTEANLRESLARLDRLEPAREPRRPTAGAQKETADEAGELDRSGRADGDIGRVRDERAGDGERGRGAGLDP